MKAIINRCLKALNLAQFNKLNAPLEVGELQLTPPIERQYVLRCLVKQPFKDFAIPDFLEWCRPMIEMAVENQTKLGLIQPFCYVTVRHGAVDSVSDDEWHVDGFSMNITHLPEQNYIWCSHTPTEYITKKLDIPSDFNPFKHNLHLYIQDNITAEDKIKRLRPNTVNCVDTYVIHRRPAVTQGMQRTFVRLSFTPIEINDVNNTINPLIDTRYTRDGKKEFRDKLERYR